MSKISFLHTADVHIQTFEALLETQEPAVERIHTVRSEWLHEARTAGMTEELERQVSTFLVEQAKSNDAVLCTCSTLGPIADKASKQHANILRIDRPLMEAATCGEGTVVVAICLDSTTEPTLALLREAFKLANKPLDYTIALCDKAWPLFEAGDTDGFAKSITKTVLETCAPLNNIGCVILAQASMAVAEPYLAGIDIPVLSSPKLAAEAVVKIAKSKGVS